MPRRRTPLATAPPASVGTQGARPRPAQPEGSAHQADEVGAPGVTQQVGQHNLEGLGSGAPRRDHHILGWGWKGVQETGQRSGQGSAQADVRGEPQLRGVLG